MSQRLPFSVQRVINHYRWQQFLSNVSLFKQTYLLLNAVIVINLLVSQPKSSKVNRIYT